MIYFAQIENNGPIKIGKAGYPPARLQNLQVSLPYQLRLLLVLYGEEDKEKHLHDKFKAHRIRGEWFHPHEDILTYIHNKPMEELPLTKWVYTYNVPYERTSCHRCKHKTRCSEKSRRRYGHYPNKINFQGENYEPKEMQNTP